MRVVYIAGAYRSPSSAVPGHQDAWGVQQNVMRAMACALDVWQAGAVALCPHANAMFFQNAAPDAVWLAGGLELLRRCDAVYLVPGWESSTGTRAELDWAGVVGIPILRTSEALSSWLSRPPLLAMCDDADPR